MMASLEGRLEDRSVMTDYLNMHIQLSMVCKSSEFSQNINTKLLGAPIIKQVCKMFTNFFQSEAFVKTIF